MGFAEGITEEQAADAYTRAAEQFALPVSKAESATPGAPDVPALENGGWDVNRTSPQAQHYFEGGNVLSSVKLQDLRVAVDVENQTIREVMNTIMTDAAEKTGPWEIKWRLATANNAILDEKVNITAETTFGEFMDYLVDRINNMTGIKLFVSVFDASRIIIISDTQV